MVHFSCPRRKFLRLEVLALFLTSATGQGAPSLGSASQWGTGIIVWEATQEGRLMGRPGPEMALACDAAGTEPVIQGTWQGNVLVGSVRLCQSGPHCTRTLARYPLFGFYAEGDHTLVARVRLDDGCSSTALQDQRLLLEPVTANLHSLEGRILLSRGDFSGARRAFQEGLRAHEDEGSAFAGLGEAELRLGRVDSAIGSFQQALSRKPSGRIEYGLACGFARRGDRRRALMHLGLAAERGVREQETPGAPPLLGDPGCQSLLRRLRGRRSGSAGTGLSQRGGESR